MRGLLCFFLGLGLIVLFICILIGFMCALLGARLVGRETDTSTGVACIDNLKKVIQRYSHSIILHHGIKKPHQR